MYLLEVYPSLVAASVMAALGLMHYMLVAAVPLSTVSTLESLGVTWATSMYGFIVLTLLPIPWVFSKWGSDIRGWSKFDAASI